MFLRSQERNQENSIGMAVKSGVEKVSHVEAAAPRRNLHDDAPDLTLEPAEQEGDPTRGSPPRRKRPGRAMKPA